MVHAESPATPGIDVLLTAGGTLRHEGWWDAVAQAGAHRRVGRYLVDSGHVPGGALELCHLGALYDAAFFALARTGTPARFRYGVAHWIGPVRPVPVAAVERETLRRREFLDRIWPDAACDGAPLLRTAAYASDASSGAVPAGATSCRCRRSAGWPSKPSATAKRVTAGLVDRRPARRARRWRETARRPPGGPCSARCAAGWA
ncbi:hypothetical protein SCALM49S_03507 [Streptomyces californicus]